MWKQIFRRWHYKLLGLVLGFAGVVLDHTDFYSKLLNEPPAPNMSGHDLGESVTIALIFVGLVFVIEALYGIGEEIEDSMKEISAQLNRSVDSLANTIKIQHNESQTKLTIAELKGKFISKLLESVNDEVKSILHPLHDGFYIESHAFALSSYSELWDILIEEQISRGEKSIGRGKKLQSLNVIATHRCSIKIWLDSSLDNVLDKQYKFVSHGGKITRILCGKGDKPDPDYCTVAAKMKAHKIDVLYHNLDKKVLDNQFHSGFLHVIETNETLMWAEDSIGTIKKATYLSSPRPEGMNISMVWERLSARSVPFPEHILPKI